MTDTGRDISKYPLCEPWYGEKGPKFTRRFALDFMSALGTQRDKFATIRDHMKGRDPGGIPPTAAAQLAAGHVNPKINHPGGTLGTESQFAFSQREQLACDLIRKYIPVPSIQTMIDGMVINFESRNYAAGSPVLEVIITPAVAAAGGVAAVPPVYNYPADHPLTGTPLSPAHLLAYQTCGDSLARHIWGTIEKMGTKDTSGANTVAQDNIWSLMTLDHVDVGPRTITETAQLLDTLNLERTVQKTAEERRLKLLVLVRSCGHAAMRDRAVAELANPATDCRDAAGVPCYLATTAALQALWESYVELGDIKPRSATSLSTARSVRVDGLSLRPGGNLGGNDDDHVEPEWCNETESQDADAFFAAHGQPQTNAMGEPWCWNCLGWGHTKNVNGKPYPEAGACPSPRKSRDVALAATALADRQRQNNQSSRNPSGPAGRNPGGPTKRRFMPRASQRKPPSTADAKSAEAEEEDIPNGCRVDSEGYVLDADENVVGRLVHEDSKPADPSADSLEFGSTVALGYTLNLDETDAEKSVKPEEEEQGADFADQYDTGDPWEYVNGARRYRNRTAAGLAVGAAMLVGAMVGIAAAAGGVQRTRKPLAALATLLFATSASALSACAPAPIDLGYAFPLSPAKDTSIVSTTTMAKVDTGCTYHATGRRSLFPDKHVTNWKPNVNVRAANQTTMPVNLIGSMVVVPKGLPQKKKKLALHLPNSLHVPKMGALVLISPRQLYAEQGIKTYFNDNNVMLLPNGDVVPFEVDGKGYSLEIEAVATTDAALIAECLALCPYVNDDLNHIRCCHFSSGRLKSSCSAVIGVSLDKIGPCDCQACVRGGIKCPHAPRQITNAARNKTKKFGQKIWGDSCAMPVSEPYGYVGWCAFLDDATRYLGLYYIRDHTAAEILRCMDAFCTDNKEYLTKVNGIPCPDEWCTDNGTEFISASNKSFAREMYMRHTTTVEWNPQSNPTERSHGIVIRQIRIMHVMNNTPLKLWPFSANQIVYVHNALLSRSAHVIDPTKSPYEMRTGRKCNLSMLRAMYCKVVFYVRSLEEKKAIGKLDPPTVIGTFLGNDFVRGGCYVYVDQWQRFTTIRFGDCTFYEAEFPVITGNMQGHMLLDQLIPKGAAMGTDRLGRRLPERTDSTAARRTRAPRATARPTNVGATAATGANVGAMPPPVIADADSLHLSFNEIGLPYVNVDTIGDDTLCLNLDSVGALPPPPKKLKECKDRPDGELWMGAAQKEFFAKTKNGTFILVDRTQDMSVMKTRVTNRYKYDPTTGCLPENGGHQVRWVGCGYSQIWGKNFYQTYTGTPKASGVRLFSAAIPAYDLETCVIDAEKFFTNNDLKEILHCEQMEEFVEGGYFPSGHPMAGKSKKVCLLKKCLEGTKQAGNEAQTNNVAHLTGPCKLDQLVTEPTCFKRWFEIDGTKVLLMLLVWIDDIFCAFSRGGYQKILLPFYHEYTKRFPAKLLGPIKRYVGVDFTHDVKLRTMTLSQETYIVNMVPKFVKPETLAKKVELPAVATHKGHERFDPYYELLAIHATVEPDDLTTEPYLSALASTMYAVVFTQGHLAYHVSFLSRFSSKPTKKAWDALVIVMTYMYQKRSHHKLKYVGGSVPLPSCPSCRPHLNYGLFQQLGGFIVFTDASWKNDCTYAGMIVMYRGSAVDWASVLMKVKCSSAEAEIGAGSLGARRLVYCRNLIGEIFGLPEVPIAHVVDNSATPPLTENLGVAKKTEHFQRWIHYMRYCVLHGYIYVHLCKTDEMYADALTKISNHACYNRFVKFFFNLN